MPILTIFPGLTTAPFASDDLHIICLILGVYRAILLLCLIPMLIEFYIRPSYVYTIDGIPEWCTNSETIIFAGKFGLIPIYPPSTVASQVSWYNRENVFVQTSLAYFLIDVAWLIILWAGASIGTPAQPRSRDAYIRNLIKFKFFFTNVFLVALLIAGIYYPQEIRRDNYHCGSDGEPKSATPDEGVWYLFFCILIVTYAVELMVWPAIYINKLTRRVVKMTNPYCCSNRYNISGRGGKAERFQWHLGLLIKFVSLLTRGKLGGKYLKKEDELTDFVTSIITMLNNETKLGFVFSDIYVGMKIHSRVQAEKKHHVIRDLLSSHKQLDPTNDESSLVPLLSSSMVLNRPTTVGGRQTSIFILQRKDGTYKTSERTILDSDDIATRTVISDSAHYVVYASYVYVKLQACVVKEYLVEHDTKVDMISCFRRKLDTLFDDNKYRLTSIGLEHARLCYSNFTNDIIATPYSIVIDDKMKTIVITVRGTRSLEDLVVDLQFTPKSLVKVGRICGFDGAGHWCHKGFLARSKWIYNDIKRTKVLNTLYLETSPYNTYPLVLCGHSLGAGCASILSLMLRPAFPSLQCFAYEPPGCIVNAELSELCAEFITSFVRHDDCIPRISYHNLELLRDEFFTTFERIKVPKIELYRHLRVPYSEVHVASRNAKVLRQIDKTPLESTFTTKIEQFRAERAIKNVATVPLFIPGNIIHLVDASGDEKQHHYVPYWAKRTDFKLELSQRMYADHDIHSLPDILKDIKINLPRVSTFAIKPMTVIEDDDEYTNDEDDAVQLFYCRYHPLGKLPIIMSILGSITFVIIAFESCDLLRISVHPSTLYDAVNASENYGLMNVTFGLWLYELVDCDNTTGSCYEVEDFFHSETYLRHHCQPYPIMSSINQSTYSGRWFYSISIFLQCISVFMILVSVLLVFDRWIWMLISIMLLLATCFRALILIFIAEIDTDWCSGTCYAYFGLDAWLSVAVCVLLVVMALSSGYSATVGKKKISLETSNQ